MFHHTTAKVMLVHCNNHPHVLLLKNIASTPDKVQFELPGGKKKPGESDQTAVNRILNKLFSRTPKPRSVLHLHHTLPCSALLFC
jgi:hypothetical protein